MSMTYTTVLGWGFVHAFSFDDLKKFSDLGFNPSDDAKDNLHWGVFELMEFLGSKYPDLWCDTYHTESRLDYKLGTAVFFDHNTVRQNERTSWKDYKPEVLRNQNSSEELTQLAAILGEDVIGWVHYANVC